jgi:Ribonucleotide reductase, small chain
VRRDYEDLYARWERGNWRALEIDFSEDTRQWREEFSELERRAALWNYALFFWGEDAVADGLSPYIDAAPLEEQKYFLATQQVDEARHAVFFSRFMHEVVGIEGTSTQERLAALEPQLTWGFRKVFERLEAMSAQLRRRPTLPSWRRRSLSTTSSSRRRSPSRGSTSSRATWSGAGSYPASARGWSGSPRTSSGTSASG